ncbi:MAG TPA: DNA polymerase Y family protein [Verrucomicrobia bacterium]|nr:DNA polymerase Y family protein [Verrucomicrobiota bacterium]HOB31273.1 DNA polymerase Y family protein [Verrucomicrobiota bacterium]HOP96500.1 DNA polymerase Y family protein [Verrucomicrobiota bacterium]HPU54800.1 DNA polymerase Y family protein [Verrucomicrobiota bacterium]
MFAVAFIPDFSLRALLRLEPELQSRPVALLDSESPKPVVIQLTPAARARGVEEGLTASQAMARCSDVLIRSRSAARETAATEALLQTAYAFSPVIEETAPGVCTLELKGLALDTDSALHTWAERLRQALVSLNLDAQIGVAATPALAALAARAAAPVRIVRDSLTFASDLPVAALDPSPETANLLERWGIRTVGALLALDRPGLAERLGSDALALLERVSPGRTRPLRQVVPRDVFEERIEFENEIETAEPLLFVLRRFVEQLARRLEVIHLVVGELHLNLGLSSGAVYEHAFRIPAPTSHVETLFRMLQTHVDTLRTDAPIVWLRMEARPCRPKLHQFGLFETTLKDPNQFAETLARLTALCGPGRVGTPVREPTHRPDAFRLRPPQFDAPPAPIAHDELLLHMQQKLDKGLQLRRLREAVEMEIEFFGERPIRVHSRVVSGVVARARGPFLSSGEWWDDNRWSREEWDVQMTDGVLYRVVRSPQGCFLEGVYD